MLHRAQVYIETEQIRQLKQEAVRERVPVAVLIRKAINAFLEAKEKSVSWNRDPLTMTVGKLKLDVDDASLNHDHYLYGRRKG